MSGLAPRIAEMYGQLRKLSAARDAQCAAAR
jgi:hypothetical protein